MRAGFDIPAADERFKEVDSAFVGVSESDNDDNEDRESDGGAAIEDVGGPGSDEVDEDDDVECDDETDTGGVTEPDEAEEVEDASDVDGASVTNRKVGESVGEVEFVNGATWPECDVFCEERGVGTIEEFVDVVEEVGKGGVSETRELDAAEPTDEVNVKELEEELGAVSGSTDGDDMPTNGVDVNEVKKIELEADDGDSVNGTDVDGTTETLGNKLEAGLTDDESEGDSGVNDAEADIQDDATADDDDGVDALEDGDTVPGVNVRFVVELEKEDGSGTKLAEEETD